MLEYICELSWLFLIWSCCASFLYIAEQSDRAVWEALHVEFYRRSFG